MITVKTEFNLNQEVYVIFHRQIIKQKIRGILLPENYKENAPNAQNNISYIIFHGFEDLCVNNTEIGKTPEELVKKILENYKERL